MKFKLFCFVFSLFVIASSLLPKIVRADDAFAVDANVTYKVEDTGKTLVTHDITLENLYSTLYATTYTLTLNNIDAQNVVVTSDNGKNIPIETNQNGSNLSLKLDFQMQL